MGDALSRKERVKSRRVRGMILATQSEAFKQENVLAERLHGLKQPMERKGDESLYFMDQIWVLLVESVMVEAHASRRKPLESEVGDRVLLKVLPWKGVVRLGKKGKFAQRHVRPFEILERIGLVAYRLRLPEELNSVHDTFNVSNLKKCLGNANLHVPLNEIKIDKTIRFVKEPVEIMDREIKSLKRSRIPLVKVRWNSKCGPEFTWEREDYMKSKYPHLFVDRAVELTRVSLKTAPFVGKKHVWTSGNSSKTSGNSSKTSGNSSKTISKANVSTSSNGTFSLSNSFEALNVDDLVTEEVESGNKASTSGVQGSKDEVEIVDNEMTSFLSSKSSGVGYDTKSLLEQWRETYGNNYYDPYDDDMYEGHEIPDNIQSICDNLNIKVRGRKKK
ncbi:hypothetical protein Tco_0026341 [Tanacetum coccineum]